MESTIEAVDNTETKIEIKVAPIKHWITKEIYWNEVKNDVEDYRNELSAWFELLPTNERAQCIKLPIKQQLEYAKQRAQLKTQEQTSMTIGAVSTGSKLTKIQRDIMNLRIDIRAMFIRMSNDGDTIKKFNWALSQNDFITCLKLIPPVVLNDYIELFEYLKELEVLNATSDNNDQDKNKVSQIQ